MITKRIAFFLLPILLITLAGCATARKQNNLEIQGLRNQVSALEAQLEAKDEELSTLRSGLDKMSEEKWSKAKATGKIKAVGEVKSRPTIKQIQTALTNAGYNPGVIDGRMGRQTREAIRAFQSTNNLMVDGKVGKKTWGLLEEYLYKKNK
ncbi:MAG: peptidoglycan-binding domain-containing protein [Candidatus Omnitrophica bacterium]|nr:peptidoglycan-binding domain-containing protein [Candidatus Omnitrophota bacterium]